MRQQRQAVARGKALAPAVLVRPASVEIDMVDDGVSDGGDELSEREAAFVYHFTEGAGTAGKREASALAAGYSVSGAANSARHLLSRPRILSAIDAKLREAIGADLTVQAVHCIREILASEDASLKLKGDMAAKVLEFSGLVERTKLSKANETGLGGGKKLAEMSRTELEAVVMQGAAVLRAASTAEKTIEGSVREAADLREEGP